jgi:hypothetical protein
VMQCLHDKRLGDGAHNGNLLRLKRHNRLPDSLGVHDGSPVAVLGGNYRSNL